MPFDRAGVPSGREFATARATPRGLEDVLRGARRQGRTAVLVDIKQRSPRDGVLIADERFEAHVDAVVRGGAEALAIPTRVPDYGRGLAVVASVRARTDLALLRKELFTAPWQMDESLDVGFDAVQLSLGTIPDDRLFERTALRAAACGLDVVVGVHGPDQLARALMLGATTLGINNRDIVALELDDGDVTETERLLPRVPDTVAVLSESAMLTADDVARAAAAGSDGVLLGTSVARHRDPASFVQALRAGSTRAAAA